MTSPRRIAGLCHLAAPPRDIKVILSEPRDGRAIFRGEPRDKSKIYFSWPEH